MPNENTSRLDFPLTVKRASNKKTPTQGTPPASLRELAIGLQMDLDRSMFINQALTIVGRKSETRVSSWVIRFTAEENTISRRVALEIGEPYLEPTVQYSEDKLSAHQCWDLYLHNQNKSSSILIGSSRPNDMSSLEQLLSAVNEPEALISMAAITDPYLVSELTKRLASQKQAKEAVAVSITPQKVREILITAGLGKSKTANIWGGARLASASIKTGKGYSTIAIGVQACPYTLSRPYTEEEKQRLKASVGPESYKTKYQIEKPLVEEARKKWHEAAEAALKSAGWSLLSTEATTKLNSTRWYTLLNESAWAALQPLTEPSISRASFSRIKPF